MNKIKIIPAILEKDFEEVKKLIEIFSKISVSLQIDVCDGVFVESKTWRPNAFDDINGYLLDLEFDMMVEEPLKYLDQLAMYDAEKIIIHSKNISAEEFKDIYKKIKEKNSIIQVGICDTDTEKIKSLCGHYDYVQLMGIEHVGKQGQPFYQKVLEYIKDLRYFFMSKDQPNFVIQIDGAMNPETIKKCKDAGANSFVVGSYLKNSIKGNKLKDTFQELKRI